MMAKNALLATCLNIGIMIPKLVIRVQSSKFTILNLKNVLFVQILRHYSMDSNVLLAH